MAKIKNLAINLQTGTDNTLYASWEFDGITKTTSGGISVGSKVTILAGATYYNGVSIPSWVMSDTWIISSIKGDRAVLGKNVSGKNNINSPINVKYLSTDSGSSSVSESIDTLDHYEVKWTYDTGDKDSNGQNIWFSGSSSNVTETHATYSIPSNASRVKVSVTPVAKTYKQNDKDVPYWDGTGSSKIFVTLSYTLDTPSAPSVTINKQNQLTASLENISDARADKIEFYAYHQSENNGHGFTASAYISNCRCSITKSVNPGCEYRVRCRSVIVRDDGSTYYSDWSPYSPAEQSVPAQITGTITCSAASETSVYLAWTAQTTATSYEIERATEKRYFDGSDQTTTTGSIETNHYELSGLDTGDEHFFRVRAVNSQGAGPWSEIVSVVLGKKPAAPTTWSSTTTVVVGEPLTLYWIHNSEDNSSETYADLELIINGETQVMDPIKKSDDEDEKDKIACYVVDTSSLTEGAQILWRVRTAGITLSYGDWSAQRTVDVYAKPTLSLNITNQNGDTFDTFTAFPFYVYALAGPNTQLPIGYHLTITAEQSYEATDQIGNKKFVNSGDAVYSKYFDIDEELVVELSAGNVDFENNVTYKVTCVVSMNSGLTAEASSTFTVEWVDALYEPDAEMMYDDATMTMHIRPYCRDENSDLVEDVTLSVYRREFDGTFTEIMTGIDNVMNTYVTDPHPALDYARYRIVAITKSTGAVSFYDPPGYYIGGNSVIIQWEEAWSNFDIHTEDAMDTPAWTGSMVKIPYNIDISESRSKDVTLVEYNGRKHPVSYYGTQTGESASWSVEIPKDDTETLYAIRRLSVWMGDVYVREPSGSGYWASIEVSFSQNHGELTIPISFDVTRVEGGI